MRAQPPPIARCFIDTSAYFALANRRDADHERATSLLHSLAVSRVRLYTTNFILAETHALTLKRLDRSLAASYVRGIYQSAMTVVRVSTADERRAWEIIGRYSDKDFSFTDATSFAVMERLHIQHVFTLDRDFVQYGFISLVND